MKKSALALVLLAMASIAHAGSADDFSLLRCGVIFGGKTLTYDANSATTAKFDARMNHVVGAVKVEPAQFGPSLASESTTSTSKAETRLPPKFTLATLGCSWR